MAVQGLQLYNAATVYAADSSPAESLEAGLSVSTIHDGSLVFVRSNNGTYRWHVDSLENPVDPRIVLPAGRSLSTPGRWVLIAEVLEGPGSSYVYQPGGQEGIGVVTNASEIAGMLVEAMEKGYGYSTLVVDGTYSNGAVSFSSSFNLLNFFDVSFINVESVTLSLPSQQALFRNPRSSIKSNRPVHFQRANTNQMHLVQVDNDPAITSTAVVFSYMVWDMTSFSTADVGAMVMSMIGGTVRFEFDDCSLSPNLSVPRAEDKWIWAAGTAPDSMELVWRGSFAAQLVQGNSQFMYTVLSGWDTVIYYGSQYGAMLTLPSVAWAAGDPTIVDIRP